MTSAVRRAATPAQARWALAVLFLVSLFNYVDRSLLSILQVPIKTELKLDDTQLGALTGISFALFYAIAAVPMAWLVDRVRRTWLMAAALGVWTTMTALSSLASSFATLAAFRVGVGLGEAGSVPAIHSLLSDYFKLKSRGAAFALWAFASPMGILLGVFSGGWLAQALGWRMSFLVVGLSGLLIVPLLLLLVEPVRGQSDDVGQTGGAQAAAPPFLQGLKLLWGLKAFRLLIVGTSLQSFAYVSLQSWLPPFFARVHHMPLKSVALWSGLIMGLGAGLGSFLGGMLVDRLTKRDLRWFGWGPAAANVLAVPFGIAALLSPGSQMAIPLGFVTFILAAVYVAPVNVAAQSMVPATIRGLTAAMLILVPTIVGGGFGPLLTGMLSDLLSKSYGPNGLRYAVSIVLCASLFSGLFLVWMARVLGRQPVGGLAVSPAEAQAEAA